MQWKVCFASCGGMYVAKVRADFERKREIMRESLNSVLAGSSGAFECGPIPVITGEVKEDNGTFACASGSLPKLCSTRFS